MLLVYGYPVAYRKETIMKALHPLSAIAIALMLGLSNGVHAIPNGGNGGGNGNSGGGNSVLCAVTEVSLGVRSQADRCHGYFALDNYSDNSVTTQLNLVDTYNDWVYITRAENSSPSSGTLGNIKFELSNDSIGENAGSWTLTWTDTNGTIPLNLPMLVDLAIALKGGSGQSGGGIAYYIFEDFGLIAPSGSSATGTFNLLIKQGLSFEALLARDLREKTPPEEVPEPTILGLIGLGLLGLAYSRRRTR